MNLIASEKEKIMNKKPINLWHRWPYSHQLRFFFQFDLSIILLYLVLSSFSKNHWRRWKNRNSILFECTFWLRNDFYNCFFLFPRFSCDCIGRQQTVKKIAVVDCVCFPVLLSTRNNNIDITLFGSKYDPIQSIYYIVPLEMRDFFFE